jgi:hypothetical protein
MMSPDRIEHLRREWPDAAEIVMAAVEYVRASDALDFSAKTFVEPIERQRLKAVVEKRFQALRQAVKRRAAGKQEGLFGG